MHIYTLPNLARALGVTYPVVYALRARGFLQPTQVNGSREYYTLDDYAQAAARSVEERNEARAAMSATLRRPRQQNKPSSNRIDYDALFKAQR
jgi:hypothetical protein